MNDKPVLSKEYSISMKMFENAFKDFQKKFVYPKNILMSAVFGLIAVSYLFSLLDDPGNSVCIMIIVICLFLIGGIWINSWMIRKNLLNSIVGIQDDRYIAELYQNSISIGTVEQEKSQEEKKEEDVSSEDDDSFFAEKTDELQEKIAKTIIDYSNDKVKIIEKKDYFIVYLIKKMFYVIPKEAFSSDEIDMLKQSFSKTKFTPAKS